MKVSSPITQTETVWEVEILLEYIQRHNLNLTKFFLDVGCGDGQHQSNSSEFIKFGWKAILIDGLQSNIDKCWQLYGNTSNVNSFCLLVSDKDERVRFVENKQHWSLSKISEGQPNRHTDTLSKVLRWLAVTEIGILSLDIEGNEGGVLKDLLENNIYPEIIIVEGNTFEAMQEHREILKEHYDFIFGVFPNQVFIKNNLLKPNFEQTTRRNKPTLS